MNKEDVNNQHNYENNPEHAKVNNNPSEGQPTSNRQHQPTPEKQGSFGVTNSGGQRSDQTSRNDTHKQKGK